RTLSQAARRKRGGFCPRMIDTPQTGLQARRVPLPCHPENPHVWGPCERVSGRGVSRSKDSLITVRQMSADLGAPGLDSETWESDDLLNHRDLGPLPKPHDQSRRKGTDRDHIPRRRLSIDL